MKNIFQNILIGIIITISGFLVVSNIEHIIHINERRYVYDDNNNGITIKIKESLKNIEKNLSKMDNLKNSYLSDDDIKKIKESMAGSIEQIKSVNISKYKDKQMNQVEFREFAESTKTVKVLNLINQYRTLSEKNDSLDIKPFIQYSLLLFLSDNDTMQSLNNNYRYQNGNIDYNSYDLTGPLSVVNNLLVKVQTIEYISNLVLESGDISE